MKAPPAAYTKLIGELDAYIGKMEQHGKKVHRIHVVKSQFTLLRAHAKRQFPKGKLPDGWVCKHRGIEVTQVAQ